MSDNNNFYDKIARRKYIQKCDWQNLNDYLKYIEKLSQKGGKYLDIYIEDCEFILNTPNLCNNIFEKSNNIINMNEKDEILDTEVCIQKINTVLNIN